MMIGTRCYIGDGTEDAAKSLTHDGSEMSAKISTTGFSPDLYNGKWAVTAWIRPIIDSASRDMYAFFFGGIGLYVNEGGYFGLRYYGGSTYSTRLTVKSGEWYYVSLVSNAGFEIRIDTYSNFSIHSNMVTPVDRLSFLADDYNRINGAWHGDITRICIFPRALKIKELQEDKSACGAAPVGAAHWWDFSNAESGVATDRIGGVRLQIPPGFVTRSTPWP